MDDETESKQSEQMRERVLAGDFAPEPLSFDENRDDAAQHHPLQER